MKTANGLFVLMVFASCTSGGAAPVDSATEEPAGDAVDQDVTDMEHGDVPPDPAVDDARPEDSTGDLDGPEDAPPACPAASGATMAFSPAEPWAGGRVRISASSPEDYTNVALEIVGWEGPDPVWGAVETDETGHTWWWSLDLPAPGSWCVLFRADPDGTLYGSAVMVVGEAPPAGLAYKVDSNHQWTCEEEFTWAIVLRVVVEDEAGTGIEGVRVAVAHSDCETAADHPPPAELVTGADGSAEFENYSPGGISDWPANICIFSLEVADAPSDRAVEISTGIWEDVDGCNYCSTFAENVWGHWSYTVTFRRDPAATETCEVPSDHAGQSNCPAFQHFYTPGPCQPLP